MQTHHQQADICNRHESKQICNWTFTAKMLSVSVYTVEHTPVILTWWMISHFHFLLAASPHAYQLVTLISQEDQHWTPHQPFQRSHSYGTLCLAFAELRIKMRGISAKHYAFFLCSSYPPKIQTPWSKNFCPHLTWSLPYSLG